MSFCVLSVSVRVPLKDDLNISFNMFNIVGMYFCKYDEGEMASMVYNWESDAVDAVVVTDGSRVLGLGDLGIGGLGISIGKLDLYVAAGGFHPRRVLPIVLDVGTNNEKLLNDPRYLGIKDRRMEGEEYYALIDEFMAAIKLRWPRALVQFEDFQSKYAIKLLQRSIIICSH